MSNKDTISHDYMSDNERFADAFNYFIYGGRQVIKPENLIEADVTESSVMKDSKGIVTNKKIRDLLKNLTVKRDNNAVYAILGIENQSLIHYAMPVRALVYDALNYDAQVSAERKRLKKSKKRLTEEELLSGFSKSSKLIPVITIVINWSGKEWEAPTRLSTMFVETDKELIERVNDYQLNLIDPYTMTDFDKLHTMLGDVMELIKYQNDGNYLKRAVKEKGENWALDIDSVNMVNAFTTANIPVNEAKEGKVIMCRMTEAIREEGRDEGRDALLIKQICKKLSKGKDQTTIIEELEMEDEEDQEWTREIIDVANDFGPDYDPDRVFEAYMELQPKT